MLQCSEVDMEAHRGSARSWCKSPRQESKMSQQVDRMYEQVGEKSSKQLKKFNVQAGGWITSNFQTPEYLRLRISKGLDTRTASSPPHHCHAGHDLVGRDS